MSNYKIIVTKINEVLTLTNAVLTEEQVDSVKVLNEGGEWNLSFETLCDVLYEYELPISQQTYELLEEIGSTIKVEKDYWEVLKPQIQPNSERN